HRDLHSTSRRQRQMCIRDSYWTVHAYTTATVNQALDAGATKKEQRQQQAEIRKKLQPLKNKLKSHEKKMEELQSKLSIVDDKLSDSTSYEDDNKDNLVKWIAQQGSLKQELSDVEESWFAISEELESFEG
ncbi:MAG: hypothetical protein KUG72_11460, partial [Pseudomonadales bacterium]|nr:hypothetical protein [Pseudomonadales bacterium]